LLLQVQGMMAEYERAKILERHRRGKLHAARGGVGQRAQWRALWLPLRQEA
jgi:DNA invertase Pin-like site-specific DNA recombinase